MKTSQLMLYKEIIAICSEIHINTLCGQNVELLNVKLVVYIVITGIESVKRSSLRSYLAKGCNQWRPVNTVTFEAP